MKIGTKRSLVVLTVALLLALIWGRPADDLAKRHIAAGLERSLITFAAARTLNGLLSVAQSASVNVSIGVAGTSIQPAAVLDPIDDLVEQFSALVLAASVSFAIQRIAVELFGAWPVCALLSLLLVACVAMVWQGKGLPPWLRAATLFLVFARLVIPVVAIGSETIYQAVLADSYDSSQKELANAAPPELAQLQSSSRLDRIKEWWSESTDVAKKIEAFKERADALVKDIIRLAAVFIVQTLVLPLLFLWLLVVLFRASLRPAAWTSPHLRLHGSKPD
jgi:hypothetical protein